jgi:hypothetical protein
VTPTRPTGLPQTAAGIGLSPAGPAATNSLLLETALFGPADVPLDLHFDGQTYPFLGAVRWPTDRAVRLALNGSTLVQAHATHPLFLFLTATATGYFRKWAVAQGPGRLETAGGPCLATAGDSPWPVRFHRLLLADLFLFSPAAYCIDFRTGYSNRCELRDVEGGPAGLLRWLPGPDEPHATSNLLVRGGRAHTSGGRRLGPAVHLDGHRMFVLDGVQVEGTAGFATPDAAAAAAGVTGLLAVNPGPLPCRVRDCWFETDPAPGEFDWGVHNPFPQTAGAHRPGKVTFAGGKWDRGRASAHPNALDVLAVELADVDGEPHVEEAGRVQVARVGGYHLPADTACRDGTQDSTANQVGRHEPAPRLLYRFPGGTGIDAPDLLPGPALCWPHRHPVYGACLAVKGHGHALAGGTQRRGRRAGRDDGPAFTRALVAAPHHRRLTGHHAIWLRLGGFGGPTEYAAVADGFNPTAVGWGLPPGGWAERVIDVAEWKDARGGTLGHPPEPLVLVYALTTAEAAPAGCEPALGPITCYERLPGDGPPPGTYGVGDTVRGRDGRGVWECTRAGTSRPLALPVTLVAGSAVANADNDSDLTRVLEGDWVDVPGTGTARVDRINDDGTVTLSRPAAEGGPVTLTNRGPLFADRATA